AGLDRCGEPSDLSAELRIFRLRPGQRHVAGSGRRPVRGGCTRAALAARRLEARLMTTFDQTAALAQRGRAVRLSFQTLRQIFGGLLKLIVLLAFAFPIILMLAGSFRPNAEMFRYAGSLSIFSVVPRSPSFDAYARLLDRPLFFWQLWNTVL